MSRYRAACYHFLISLVIFIVLAGVVRLVWFPDFFFAIDGGWEGMRILIGVDLVMGPLLTLMVFRTGKPGLKFDLTLIGILQMISLAGGLHVIYSARPIFFVYYEQHFYSSSADNFSEYGVLAPDYRRFSDRSPAMVYVKLPDSPIEEAGVRRIMYQAQVPLWTFSAWYEPLTNHMDTVIHQGVTEAELRQRDHNGSLDRWLAKYGGVFEDYAFVAIHSRYRDTYLGIRKSDRSLVDIVEITSPLS